MSKRPRVLKTTTRAASGGVIVVAAVLALLFFRGLGMGSGEGESEDTGSDRPAMATTEAPASNRATDTKPQMPTKSPGVTDDSGGLTPDEQKALSGNVLGILIDEYSYLMELPSSSDSLYRPAELDRLLQLAKQAKGDSNGIRVRILRRENARASTEEQLKLELSRIGVKADAFYMPETFVP